jgi:predicted RNase H-like HicB family nuclease
MFKTAAYIERDPETGLYVAVVPGIPGAHTQGDTLDELQKNLKEVLELCLEEMDAPSHQRNPSGN